MKAAGTISSIDPDEASTWCGRIFLTFDVDWAHDEVINDTIDLVERADVSATWFVTHSSPVLERLRANPKFELGVHPNFNWLLGGDAGRSGNADQVVQEIMNIVPEATSVRSHSMAQSTGLLSIFAAAGLTHDANHFIPASVGSGLRPWRLWNGMTRVPYIWEDDVFCSYQGQSPEPDIAESATMGSGIKVFDLHPIHVFLNTEQLDRYESTRPLHQHPQGLLGRRYNGYDTRKRLLDLLAIMKSGHQNRADER